MTSDVSVFDSPTVRESGHSTTQSSLGLVAGGESEDTDDEDQNVDSTVEMKNKILKNCFASMAARNN